MIGELLRRNSESYMLKLEKLFFYLFIFCFAFQTRKIIYQFSDSFNEWTSIYLYLTDILFILILLFWILRKRKQRFFKDSLKLIKFKSPSFWLLAFLIFSLVSLIQAKNIGLGFYSWFKLLEMIILFFYLKYNFKKLFSFEKISYIFVFSGLFQSFIAIGQYIQQKSLGLKFLAESSLNPEMAGVAKIIVDGVKIIRVYGTFPHPNVLAAFIFICIFFTLYLFFKRNNSFSKKLFLIISYLILTTSLFLTFSRIVIIVFLLLNLIYFILLFKKHKKQVLIIFLLFLIFLFIITYLIWPEVSSRFHVSVGDQAISLRLFYSQTSFLIIQEYPLIGIGFGNFVWEIREMLDLLSSWIHQPVHNIYLLIASETGLIGLFLFLMFLYQLFRQFNRKLKNKKHYLLLFIFCAFLFFGLFDHYFWTLQQGQLMFWMILGLIAGYSLKFR